jgi:hypothetical protein
MNFKIIGSPFLNLIEMGIRTEVKMEVKKILKKVKSVSGLSFILPKCITLFQTLFTESKKKKKKVRFPYALFKIRVGIFFSSWAFQNEAVFICICIDEDVLQVFFFFKKINKTKHKSLYDYHIISLSHPGPVCSCRLATIIRFKQSFI